MEPFLATSVTQFAQLLQANYPPEVIQRAFQTPASKRAWAHGLWSPNDGRQTDAFESQAFETLYGGAAGGGKSELIIGLAIRQHSHSLLLRRIYSELEDSLILRARTLLEGHGSYNGSKHAWALPDGGRIRFGHLDKDKDVAEYKSAAFDLVAFDELTEFSQFQYEYLFSRARTVRKGQRVRIVAGTNPGGVGHVWVVNRWAPWLDEAHHDPALPGELRWYKRNEDGEDVPCESDDSDGLSRTFIPAALADNPYLGEDYRKILASLPEPYRSQLLNGDWKAGMVDDAYQIIPRAWIAAAIMRGRESANGDEMRLTCVAADIGGGVGRDDTVLVRVYNGQHFEMERIKWAVDPKQAYTEWAGRLIAATGRNRRIPIVVDIVGVGAGVGSILAEQGYNVIPFNGGAKPMDTLTDQSGQFRYRNWRTAGYYMFKEALDPAHQWASLALPADEQLTSDLTAARLGNILSGGMFQLEPKEALKKRLGRSPDAGDAVMMALAGPALWAAKMAAETEDETVYAPAMI